MLEIKSKLDLGELYFSLCKSHIFLTKSAVKIPEDTSIALFFN